MSTWGMVVPESQEMTSLSFVIQVDNFPAAHQSPGSACPASLLHLHTAQTSLVLSVPSPSLLLPTTSVRRKVPEPELLGKRPCGWGVFQAEPGLALQLLLHKVLSSFFWGRIKPLCILLCPLHFKKCFQCHRLLKFMSLLHGSGPGCSAMNSFCHLG